MKKIVAIFTILMGAAVALVCNGSVLSDQLGIPPLGKILNPFHGLWSSINNPKQINLNGKSGNIEIIIDKRGVPHIYAETLEDALYGQGYMEAKDRTFQMQFLRQVASGQLSEYFGSKTLEYDKWTHKKGIPTTVYNAAKTWENNPSVLKLNTPYRDGVNAYLSQIKYADLPYEFKLLNLKPKQWDIQAMACVFKYMGNVLADGNYDIEHTNVRTLLGKERYEKYYKESEEVNNPIIPKEKKYDFESVLDADVAPDKTFDNIIYNAFYEKRDKNIGSNNWTVDGNKSATGYPILCSDPHLSLSLPSIWYELNIVTPDLNVYGVSFPGIPGIMIGFNEKIAWGETNVGHDVQDLFHINYTDDTHTHYWLDGEKMPLKQRLSRINVRGHGEVVDTTLLTHFGPIIKVSNDRKADIAMDWLVAHPAPAEEINTFVNAMQCKDYGCFLEKTGIFVTPAQNFLYADASGTIGLRVNGLLPAKGKDDGKFVEEGDKLSAAWNKWIPRNQNPQIRNPKQGYIASANQRSAEMNYPYYYTGNFERYRNRAINNHLDTVTNVTPLQMMRFQHDNYSKKAEDFLPLMLADISDLTQDQVGKNILNTLKKWDYVYDGDKIAPTYFHQWFKYLELMTWDEIRAYKDTMSVVYPEEFVLKNLIRDAPEDPIFDRIYTIPTENAHDVIRIAFDSLKTYVDGKSKTDLRWSKTLDVSIPHIAQIPGLGIDYLEASGCGDAINAARNNFGPSWRMVISLGDKVNAYGIYPGGQSGDPRSPQYMNMVEKWRTGQYDTLLYNLPKSELLSYE